MFLAIKEKTKLFPNFFLFVKKLKSSNHYKKVSVTMSSSPLIYRGNQMVLVRPSCPMHVGSQAYCC